MAKLTDSKAFEGESLTATFNTDVSATAVSVTLKDGTNAKTINATKSSAGVFAFSASASDLAGFSGQVRWLALATLPDGVSSVGSGRIHIRPLVSKWREYVTAIDAAIESWGTNPNQTVTVGEISITAKTLDELVTLRDTYESRARADEDGTSFAGGPRILRTVFR